VLYDLLGRIRHEDVRERTLRGFQERYGVDLGQAGRVERIALALLTHAPRSWNLHAARDGRLLSWAARLHEIGLTVTWSKFHLHGAYLLRHADMPGFSRNDQHALATLVGSSRRDIDMSQFRGMDEDTYERIAGLIILLRLAVLLNRARSPERMPPLRLRGDPVRVRLHVSKRWLAKQPLSRLDLEEERLYLAPLGVDFGIAP
jgi:exopolyphosphatase/guanosine-5'-triphosphate,3'-diphosphate pyrophosphatase